MRVQSHLPHQLVYKHDPVKRRPAIRKIESNIETMKKFVVLFVIDLEMIDFRMEMIDHRPSANEKH